MENKGHHLFIDNYYTTLQLVDNLQKQQIATTGTMNMIRVCFEKQARYYTRV